MPAVRVRHDALVGEAPKLGADHLVVFVEPGGGGMAVLQQLDKARAGGVAVAVGDHRDNRRGAESGQRLGADAHRLGTGDLVL